MILIILLLLLFLGFLLPQRKHKHAPPGPWRLPIFGNIFQIASQSSFHSIAFQKLSKVYGDIFSVKIGGVEAIVFNSFDSVSGIMNHEHGIFRAESMVPMLFERNYCKNLGIIFASGDSQKTLRRFTIRTLKDFGFGKMASMEVIIGEELEKFMSNLNTTRAQCPDGIVEVEGLFDLTFVNILWRLVTGVNYAIDDPKINRLLKLSNELMAKSSYSMDISVAFPALWYMFPSWSGKDELMKIIHELHTFILETIEHHRNAKDYLKNPLCYVDVFLQQIDKAANEPNSEYTDTQLAICLFDLFQAGSETSNNTMGFAILYLLLHKNVQENVQKELDEVCGREGNEFITPDKRSKLPYTCATVLEVFRFSSVGAFAPPRRAPVDFWFQKYFIKKGTVLMTNLEAVHFSEEIWGDPQRFRPERFLTKEGNSIDSHMARKLLAFGGGKRLCIGQNLAEVAVFMYLANILKRFNLVKVADDPEPSTVPTQGITNRPQPFRLRFVQRK